MHPSAWTDVPPWEWPRGIKQLILENLDDRSAPIEERNAAAEMAGEMAVFDDTLAKALLAVLRNPEEPADLRAHAAISFGAAFEEFDIHDFDDPYHQPAISEEMFEEIQDTLQQIFLDESVPKAVRRRVLEASVRAPQEWHPDVIRTAYASPDEEWKLTAVFCMRWVPEFDKEIVEALDSPNGQIRYEAVQAAGSAEVQAAWPKIKPLLNERTEKELLLAAIEATATIRPEEANQLLLDLAESDDEDISDAVDEAIGMASLYSEDDDEDSYEDDEDDEDEDDEEDVEPGRPTK